jgi:hypothetical protein
VALSSERQKKKDVLLTEYDLIQQEVKVIDKEIYSLNQEQSIIKHDINRLVNSSKSSSA